MADIKRTVESIQADILNPQVPLSAIFLKTRVLARDLKNETFEQWVKCERDGYSEGVELPDYRVTSPIALGTFSNGAWLLTNHHIPLDHMPDWFREKVEHVNIRVGIRAIEEMASSTEPTFFTWLPEFINGWNVLSRKYVTEDMVLLTVKRGIPQSFFVQLLDIVRSRLQDFILEIEDISWSVESASSNHKLDRLFQLTIHNNQGANMPTFDQRGQQVQSQNNAARDVNVSGGINIGDMQNQPDFIQGLQQFKSELAQAGQVGAIDAEVVTDADFEIASAIQQVKKPQPDKNAVIKHLDNAKELIAGITATTGLIENINKLIETADKVF